MPGPMAPAAPGGSARASAARPDVSRMLRAVTTPGASRREERFDAADTVQRFRVRLGPDSGIGRRARTYRLASDVSWVRPAAQTITIDSATGSAVVELHYDRAAFTGPGRYSGAVQAYPVGDSSAASAFTL